MEQHRPCTGRGRACLLAFHLGPATAWRCEARFPAPAPAAWRTLSTGACRPPASQMPCCLDYPAPCPPAVGKRRRRRRQQFHQAALHWQVLDVFATQRRNGDIAHARNVAQQAAPDLAHPQPLRQPTIHPSRSGYKQDFNAPPILGWLDIRGNVALRRPGFRTVEDGGRGLGHAHHAYDAERCLLCDLAREVGGNQVGAAPAVYDHEQRAHRPLREQCRLGAGQGVVKAAHEIVRGHAQPVTPWSMRQQVVSLSADRAPGSGYGRMSVPSVASRASNRPSTAWWWRQPGERACPAPPARAAALQRPMPGQRPAARTFTGGCSAFRWLGAACGWPQEGSERRRRRRRNKPCSPLSERRRALSSGPSRPMPHVVGNLAMLGRQAQGLQPGADQMVVALRPSRLDCVCRNRMPSTSLCDLVQPWAGVVVALALAVAAALACARRPPMPGEGSTTSDGGWRCRAAAAAQLGPPL